MSHGSTFARLVVFQFDGHLLPLLAAIVVVFSAFHFSRCCGFFCIDMFLGARANFIHRHLLLDEQGLDKSSCSRGFEEDCNEEFSVRLIDPYDYVVETR